MKKKPLAIRVKNLTKTFKLYRQPVDILKELIFRKKLHQEFTALKNISFEINQGEVVGIIGRNGSGKSTLLKIISGNLDKTGGTVRVNGKVSAVLELGLGFNPEYTGRENIYNGALILGMDQKEIDQKIDSIIDFSELNDFIDRPFKTYSAGMQARLTFSVAAALEPEIMIIDEALAAGDNYFVAKCMDKIQDMCRSGATVLFVSHSLPTVQKLCDRAIYLEKGKIVKIGQADDICDLYQQSIMVEISQKLKEENVKALKISRAIDYSPEAGIWKRGNLIDIDKIEILDRNGIESYSFFQNDLVTFRVYYRTTKPLKNMSVWTTFHRADGVMATSFLSCIPYRDIGILEENGYIDITWPNIYLGEADYLISCGFYEYKKNKPLGNLPLDSYIRHDKRYKIHIKAKIWPLMSIYEQPVKLAHFRKVEGRIKKII